MRANSSATPPSGAALPAAVGGLWWGLLGVVAFSFTVPFTRIAVGGLPPLFIGSGRAVVAATLAAAALALTRQRVPHSSQWWRLAVVGSGIVVGFPLLTSYALTAAPASHGAMVIALLPAATAVAAVLRERSRPPLVFWLAAAAGALAAIGFASAQSDLQGVHWADLLLFGAVVSAAVGYAEGGVLARELGAWQTVSWALVLCAPVMITLTVVAATAQPLAGTPREWAAFGYLGAVSMFLGFFAWYRGLAIGPMARVSQIQLVQPVLTFGWAGLFLGEHLDGTTVIGGFVVIGCAACAVRVRLARAPRPPEHREDTDVTAGRRAVSRP